MNNEKKTKTPSAARAYLKAISPALQKIAKETGERVNDLLTSQYSRAAACADWDTFRGWKKRGYFVGKGEKGFAVWSRPITKGDGNDADDQGDDQEDTDNRAAPFYTAFIFCARQVANREGYTPYGTEYTASGLIPPHTTGTPEAKPQPETRPEAKPRPKPTPAPSITAQPARPAAYVPQLAFNF
jgi:hypothetical protein